MKYRKDYIQRGTKRRSGIKMNRVLFIVAHDTGNDGSTAAGNVNYYKTSANRMSASAHLFVDDKETVECIPLNEKAWHVLYDRPEDNRRFGDDANDAAIGVELCYFSRDKKRSLKAYENYVELLADLCKKYKLDPMSKIVGHNELDPGRKTDPINALKRINKTKQDLLRDVKEKMGGSSKKPAVKVPVNKEYTTITVKFSKGSKTLDEFEDLLKDLGIKSADKTAENKTVKYKISFAAKSSAYSKVKGFFIEKGIKGYTETNK